MLIVQISLVARSFIAVERKKIIQLVKTSKFICPIDHVGFPPSEVVTKQPVTCELGLFPDIDLNWFSFSSLIS